MVTIKQILSTFPMSSSLKNVQEMLVLAYNPAHQHRILRPTLIRTSTLEQAERDRFLGVLLLI